MLPSASPQKNTASTQINTESTHNVEINCSLIPQFSFVFVQFVQFTRSLSLARSFSLIFTQLIRNATFDSQLISPLFEDSVLI